jgi:hypothetical protein
VHENGSARLSVAASAANLLVITFQAARQCGVNHSSDVWLIDPHSECDGCHHDVQLAGHEFFLHSPPLLGVESGMVAGYGKLVRQIFRQGFRLLARWRVHDGWPVFVLE